MKMRTKIIAVCAGALTLATTLAYAGEPIPGVDTNLPKETGNQGRVTNQKTNPNTTIPAAKSHQRKAGTDTSEQIFDRWGNSRK